jgi:hypothetical protein
MCKEDCLEVKELAIEEDGEVGASLLLSKKPVSSEENTCKQDCLVVKEHAIEEDEEVKPSLHCVMPVSLEENTCKDNNL